MADYLESKLSYKYVILETPFDESEYKLLDLCSSCFPIFMIIHIFRVGSKFWWVDEIFFLVTWEMGLQFDSVNERLLKYFYSL